MLHYFLAQIVQDLPFGSFFSRLQSPCDLPSSMFFFFKYFLELQDAPASSCVFPGPVLESALSPVIPGSFYRRMALHYLF